MQECTVKKFCAVQTTFMTSQAHEKPYRQNIDTQPVRCAKQSRTYHSHTRRLLSSDVVTNLRFSSTNVIVLTAPRCRSYSWTISPDRTSHWKQI